MIVSPADGSVISHHISQTAGAGGRPRRSVDLDLELSLPPPASLARIFEESGVSHLHLPPLPSSRRLFLVRFVVDNGATEHFAPIEFTADPPGSFVLTRDAASSDGSQRDEPRERAAR